MIGEPMGVLPMNAGGHPAAVVGIGGELDRDVPCGEEDDAGRAASTHAATAVVMVGVSATRPTATRSLSGAAVSAFKTARVPPQSLTVSYERTVLRAGVTIPQGTDAAGVAEVLVGMRLAARITQAPRSRRFDSPRFRTRNRPAPFTTHQHDHGGRHDGPDRRRSQYQVDHGHPLLHLCAARHGAQALIIRGCPEAYPSATAAEPASMPGRGSAPPGLPLWCAPGRCRSGHRTAAGQVTSPRAQ